LSYNALFSSASIGSLQLRNRIIMPAMATRMAEPDYTIGERLREYHVLRAKNGCAMNITEFVAVHETSHFACTPALYDDKFIPGFRTLAGEIHKYGGRLCPQLWHAGRQTTREQSGFDPVAPSAIALGPLWPVPRELSEEEILELVDSFGAAAARAREAGADAVEIHGAHGYLVGQFVSGWSNRRGDIYGGSLENRARFALEIIRAVRARVGKDFPVIYRMSAEERVGSPGAMTTSQAVELAKLIEASGVDALHVSIGSYGDMWDMIPPIQHRPGFNVHNAAAVKAVVKLPVLAVGRINSPELADSIIAEGKADFVSIGRAQLADPEFITKSREGRAEDIVKCIGCNQGCIGRYGKSPNGAHLTCMVNPRCGHEFLYREKQAAASKKIMIAGGGIAGLSAARILKRRGHRAVLYEARSDCGGEFLLAGIPPGKREIADMVNRMIKQAALEGVPVHTGVPVNEDLLEKEKPDVLVVATGAAPVIPGIPGIEQAVLARDVLTEQVRVGKKAALIGGGLVGCETAEYLTSLGKDVFIVEMLDKLAPKADSYKQHYLGEYIKRYAIPVYLETKCTAIKLDNTGTGSITIKDKDGKESHIPVDTVVLAAGYRPQAELASLARIRNIPCFVIGDAREPRLAIDAIKEAYDCAQEIE
jgi:2,4-dienoyl-CoA reductase-like NADH-dependent reductase (Old Yellow Enzyme family)/thioredoxin reductase